MNLKETIRKYALQNAVKFKGKANPGAVIGHVLAEDPSLKARAKEISKEVMVIIKEVNKLNVEKQTEELKKTAPELLQEKKHEERERTLPKLKDVVKGKVVIRFEPSPSGPLHVGHAYVIGLNSEYCREYDGKLILRIGDTNPENIYEPAYDLIEKDAEWVTKDNIAKIYVQSERLEIYYKYMEKLIGLEKAYICTCNPDDYKELMGKGKACPCRDLPDQLERWKKMFKKYKQGEAVARIKTDIHHKNPAMRDWPAFRINDSKHPKQGKKYGVWPLMNMAVSVDDIEMKVTHIIRAKEHHDNALRQRYIYDYLGKKFPQAIFVGRINFEGMPVSCSKTRPLIEDGTYSGWDDIRLPFLDALRRRGYQPEAFIKYAIDVGVSLNDKSVTKEEFFKTINAFNKDVIEPKAYRYFFVENPKLIKIENAPVQHIELDLHPDNKKGGRAFKTHDEFYLAEDDYKCIKEDKLYRLMDCLNFVKKKNKFVFDSLEYEKFKEKGEKIIHWLPKGDLVNVEVLMPDHTKRKGLGEKNLKGLKVNELLQLERFGFCRLDNKGINKFSFWFTHK